MLWQGHASAFSFLGVGCGLQWMLVGAIRGSGVDRKADWSDSWLPRELKGFAARACETIRGSRNADVKHPPCFGRDIHLRLLFGVGSASSLAHAGGKISQPRPWRSQLVRALCLAFQTKP